MSLYREPVAVVGAGVAGATAAILLARDGASVDLVEATPEVAGGSGIMLQANGLRVLRAAGVVDQVLAAGFGFDSTGIRLPDADARLVAEFDGRMDPDLPAAVGIARGRLARLLLDHARAVGVEVRPATTVHALTDGPDGVTVDASTPAGPWTRRYALVVAADGAASPLRRMIGIRTSPRPMPLGVWRVTVPRPPSVARTTVINGGRAYFAGYAPTGPATLYAWLVEDYVDRRALPPADHVAVVRELAAGYHRPWDAIRASLSPDTPISYTRYSAMLLPPPWHRGHVVLVGDAVHACPPTMAQGAAMGLEDALVLVETLRDRPADDAALRAYADRRLPRVQAVVDGSVRMAEWQLRHEPGDVGALMRHTSALLAQPA